ncbi:hypothetical protein PPYR_09614 [Photinus pyralis]|uniref:Coiled-coil domain-containing protein 43 n=1 Tax=Photinus pyralis TaxID=7054 RepID=A0A1Y1KYQ3_PHOPY|nr:coiled-coil domain-containing protein 43 [Photinus pyralis]XP_031343720.1 coiled-coil domain-containing protein 43 [Photinus pyralis]KAB0798621.1 hypothetical protein PPYR_09614 [Photinus pyralis]
MATAVDEFGLWLGKKLRDLDIDECVFGSYISGILDGDESEEEKTDALEGILSEILVTDNDIIKIRSEIMEMWSQLRQPQMSATTQAVSSEEVDIRLARLLESQSLQIPKQKQYTDEEKKIREAILSQYSQMTDDEDDDVNEPGDVKENGLEKNRNAHAVMQAEKEKREQAKLESQKKKEKDKEDREKQKQLREEKKEKRKTQKGERRR